MFDLTIFPLSLSAGRELHELPGLFVSAAPRKAARMRAQDILLLYVTFVHTAGGNGGRPASPLTPAQQQEILTRLSETYFSFSGSVTAGLRAVAARLNDFLLSRNLKSAQEGQVVALLNLAVAHGDTLIIAHAGPTHSFLLRQAQVEHYDDSPSAAAPAAGRGLGLSRQPTVRFYQSALQSGDLLVMSAEPPAAWTARALANSPQLPFEHLRRRLLSDAGVELQTAVVRFQTGKAQVSYWRPGQSARGQESSRGTVHRPSVRGERSAPRPMAHAAEESQPPQPAAPAVRSEIPAPEDENAVSPSLAPAMDAAPREIPPAEAPAPAGQPVHEDRPDRPRPPVPLGSEPVGGTPEAEPAPRQRYSQYQPPSQETPLPAQLPASPALADEPAARPDEQPIQRTRPGRERPSPASGVSRAEASAASSGGLHRPTAGKRPATSKSAARPARQASPETGEKLRQDLAAGLRRLSAGQASVSGALSRATRRVIPTRLDEQGRPLPLFNLSPAWMLAVAVIIPLIVVAMATTVYFRAGRSEQFGVMLAQAQQSAAQAAKQKDPIIQRQYWTRTYELVSKAEAYGQSEASRGLKQQALAALDDADHIVRLSYQPAVSGGFPLDVKITRVVATLSDVYLLDASQGRVLRLYRTASGYEVDPKFTCGPGKAGATQIGPLLDIVALPPNNEMHSSVMGLDAGGNLEYCSPSQAGFDTRTLALPDAGWGKITGMALYNDSLYVLDTGQKSPGIYRFDGSGSIFDQPPHFYFDTSVPQMNDVIDMAVDQENVYMLHSDGKMTLCESGILGLSSTKCNYPAPYGDDRAGYEPAPLAFPGTTFAQIQTTEPPDPSLYALDMANKAVYHLSLRLLNFQHQYRSQPGSDFPLPAGAPTAFAVAPNRRILLAFGSQLFFAAMP